MRTIKMKSLQAGPAGIFHPGQIRVVGPEEYAVLVPDFADDAIDPAAEAERVAAEEAAKAEAERVAAEEAAKAEADRIAAEKAAKAETGKGNK